MSGTDEEGLDMPEQPEATGQESSEPEAGGERAGREQARERAAGTDQAPQDSPGRLRRLVRGKRGAALVGVLAGAVLGTGLMAWRSDELPFVSRDVCWGSLSPDVAGALIADTDVRSTELPLRRATQDPMHTECSIQGFGDDKLESEVTASVRTLGELKGAQAWNWTREYLSSRMTPLGGETPGMASATRAWVALPASCQERSYEPHEKPPLRVVSLASREADPDWENGVDARRGLDAMSRAVVRLADGVMERFGCEGRYPDPPKLPRPPEGKESKKLDADRLCGLPGVRLPRWARGEDATAVRTTPGTSADEPTPGGIRTCDVGRPIGMGKLRLTTVADPQLARVVSHALGDRAAPLTGDGKGAHAAGLSVYTANCQSGPVAFVAHEKAREADGEPEADPTAATDRRALDLAVLPSYVTAEAKRVGCGEVNVTVPGGTS